MCLYCFTNMYKFQGFVSLNNNNIINIFLEVGHFYLNLRNPPAYNFNNIVPNVLS